MTDLDPTPGSPLSSDLPPQSVFILTLLGGVLLLLAAPLVWVFPARTFLIESGFFTWFYGTSDVSDKLLLTRQALWVTAIAMPLHIAATLLLLRLGLGLSLSDVGLTTHNAGRQVLAGLVLSVIFLPGALGLNLLANQLLHLVGSAPQEHPFAQLGQRSLHPIEWGLLIFDAVVVAPVWEEIFFRGLVQRWVLAQGHKGGLAVLGVAAFLTVMALLTPAGSEGDLSELSALEWIVKLAPLWVLGLLVGVWQLIARRSATWSGLFAAAVLFGWVHVHAWPTPVPLVWLALGLGWLAWRSQSLVGSMVLHAVFNAFACGVLLLGGG